jgi:hypothetical protein
MTQRTEPHHKVGHKSVGGLDEENHDSSISLCCSSDPCNNSDFLREAKDRLHATSTDVIKKRHSQPRHHKVGLLGEENHDSSTFSLASAYSEVGNFLREARYRMSHSLPRFQPGGAECPLLSNSRLAGHRRCSLTKNHFVRVQQEGTSGMEVSARLKLSSKRVSSRRQGTKGCVKSKLRTVKHMDYREKAALYRMKKQYLLSHQRQTAVAPDLPSRQPANHHRQNNQTSPVGEESLTVLVSKNPKSFHAHRRPKDEAPYELVYKSLGGSPATFNIGDVPSNAAAVEHRHPKHDCRSFPFHLPRRPCRQSKK